MAPVLVSATIFGQGVFSNTTQTALEKVIQDYPSRYQHIKGDLIAQALQSSRYRSTVQLPGAMSGTIILTSGTNHAGWVCTVLQTARFEEAKGKFAAIYGQLSNSLITVGDQQKVILSGQYETPVEDRKYTRVVFLLLPGVGDMKKLKVELILQQDGKEWKILLTVLDGDPQEDAQLAMTEN